MWKHTKKPLNFLLLLLMITKWVFRHITSIYNNGFTGNWALTHDGSLCHGHLGANYNAVGLSSTLTVKDSGTVTYFYA